MDVRNRPVTRPTLGSHWKFISNAPPELAARRERKYQPLGCRGNELARTVRNSAGVSRVRFGLTAVGGRSEVSACPGNRRNFGAGGFSRSLSRRHTRQSAVMPPSPQRTPFAPPQDRLYPRSSPL